MMITTKMMIPDGVITDNVDNDDDADGGLMTINGQDEDDIDSHKEDGNSEDQIFSSPNSLLSLSLPSLPPCVGSLLCHRNLPPDWYGSRGGCLRHHRNRCHQRRHDDYLGKSCILYHLGISAWNHPIPMLACKGQ